MSDDTEIVKLTPEELDAMMPPGENVHTFLQAGPILLGADWARGEILQCARRRPAELAGKEATGMKHGAVVWQLLEGRETPVFIETLDPKP